jgi:hypothetical protein
MVVSCWLFLDDLYHDARIHGHQNKLLLDNLKMMCKEAAVA